MNRVEMREMYGKESMMIKHEIKHRQGMHKERGQGFVEKRNLPDQKEFVDVLRKNFTVDEIVKQTKIKKSTVEHWFRRDKFFGYPTKEDWAKLMEKTTELDWFPELLEVWYEKDEITSSEKGRNARDIWDINTKSFSAKSVGVKDVDHFAMMPEEIPRKVIDATCPEDGIVMDVFSGSGTTLFVAKDMKRNYIGIDLNKGYNKIAKNRLYIIAKKLF